MINLQFSDAMAAARAAGVKTVTRRLGCRLQPGDICFHGEALVSAALPVSYRGITHAANYRRDAARVLMATTDRGFQPWVWKRKVLPARYCPERCARMFSVIRSVRSEPLNEITEEDAIAEGVAEWLDEVNEKVARCYGEPHRAAFAMLWDSLNAQRAPWDANPTIYRVELGPVLTRDQVAKLTGIQDRARRLERAEGIAA